MGVATASNAGIKGAKGKYIVRVDGDDYINKNFPANIEHKNI